jgi:RNA polymerase sigma factor (sigma-70 family)
MAVPADEFETLMERVRSGDPEAARELFEKYGKQIQAVVRCRLNQPLRSRFDSVDFAQDAWASFFHIPPERITFRTPAELVDFLSSLARHKLIDAYRRQHLADKRQGHEVQSLNASSEEPPGRQPRPSQLAVAKEQWSQLLRDEPPRVRCALQMLLEGRSRLEVAKHMGVHPKQIQRLLRRLNRKLKPS